MNPIPRTKESSMYFVEYYDESIYLYKHKTNTMCSAIELSQLQYILRVNLLGEDNVQRCLRTLPVVAFFLQQYRCFVRISNSKYLADGDY